LRNLLCLLENVSFEFVEDGAICFWFVDLCLFFLFGCCCGFFCVCEFFSALMLGCFCCWVVIWGLFGCCGCGSVFLTGLWAVTGAGC
jgi:hypothetical protein